ncbi:MAG: NUDIX hydrolase [Actinobacteria bacterium]|nr:NUDIX hydrolase [Actinomycetota bacterium]
MPTTGRRWVVRTIAPSFTVGAMCIIERSDGALLLVRHVYRRRWGVPGGLLKRGELPADAARREVREEVGIDVELEGEPAVVVDPDPQRIDVIFRARPADGIDPATVVARSPEIEEVRWFGPDRLPELQHETAGALVALARSSAAPQARVLPARSEGRAAAPPAAAPPAAGPS